MRDLIFLLALIGMGVAGAIYLFPGKTFALQQSQNAPLKPFKWKSRLIAIVGESRLEAVSSQTGSFASDEEPLSERDTILLYIDENGVTAGQPSPMQRLASLEPQAILQWLNHRDLKTFGVYLIGKDGTVKRRSETPRPADWFYTAIDAMPMRQQEMRR